MAFHANREYGEKDVNYTMLQAFEWNTPDGGHHWGWLKGKVDKLADAGITAMWLPPPTKASSQSGNGYDVYDLYDLGEFDQKGGKATKWGSKEDLIELIKYAKSKGIVVYIDAVLNHKAGADKSETFKVKEVDQNDRNKIISDAFDIEGWTGFNFPGRQGKHSQFEWSFNHFTGVDWDQKGERNGIFKIEGENKGWAQDVDSENANYDYLMFADIDHAHPDVKKDILDWGVWVIKETDAAGFRFDAIKHIDGGFMSEFVAHVRKETKGSLFGVGEFWKESLDSLTGYLEGFGQQFSVFDVPLHYNFKEAGDRGADFDIRQIFDGTLVQKRPIDAVTFVDNHDSQKGQALESNVNPQFKPLAYSLILLRNDGYPCVFLGDLTGIHDEEDASKKIAEPVTQLADISRARKHFAYGELRDYWDHQNCVGWVRTGDEKHDGCAVIISNGGEGSKHMEVGKEHAGEVWTDALGWQQGEITIKDDGWAEFKCPGMSVAIWTKKDARGREKFGKSG